MKILLGQISSNKAITVARFLKQYYPQIFIYTYDYKSFTTLIHTRYSDRHFTIDKNDLKLITQLIKEENIDFFVPVINDDIKTIIKNKKLFGNSLSYLGDIKKFELLNSKSQIMMLSTILDIDIPKTYKLSEKINVFPGVLKPINSSSSKGVKYIYNEKDLKDEMKNIENFKNYIYQQYIEGIGVGYSVYAKNGEIISGYGHKRLAEYPISGGTSMYRETYADIRMKEVAEKILTHTKWTGFAMFEFKLSKNNELKLIEVNPRIWGSINQGLQNGVNYFEYIISSNSNNDKFSEKNDIKTFFNPHIYIALLKYCMKLNFSPLKNFIKNIKYNRPDVSLFKDPLGFLSIVLRKLL